MFRGTSTQALAATDEEQLWPVLNRDVTRSMPVPAVIDEARVFRSAPAAPDVPAAVGVLLFASYLALIGALALATRGPGQSGFMLVIAGLFVVAFFTVPRLILAQEPKNGHRVRMDCFLANGLDTNTGHCSGRAALVQMLVVPMTLTFGVLLIAIVIVIG